MGYNRFDCTYWVKRQSSFGWVIHDVNIDSEWADVDEDESRTKVMQPAVGQVSGWVRLFVGRGRQRQRIRRLR